MSRLGLESLCVLGLPPVDHVRLAADLGCTHISTGLERVPFNPHDYPAWSLRDDPALRREMIAAMRDRGVIVSLGEGLLVRPGGDVRDHAADLDLMAELGARKINSVSLDPDVERSKDQIAIQVEMIQERGMEAVIEFAPSTTFESMPAALEVIRHSGRPGFRLLVDTMHLIRSGSTPADLAALAPDMIGYVQLCDTTLVPTIADYMLEATFERLAPGTGELPLGDILAALPSTMLLGLEIPRYKDAEAGVGPYDRLKPAVDGANAILDALAMAE